MVIRHNFKYQLCHTYSMKEWIEEKQEPGFWTVEILCYPSLQSHSSPSVLFCFHSNPSPKPPIHMFPFDLSVLFFSVSVSPSILFAGFIFLPLLFCSRLPSLGDVYSLPLPSILPLHITPPIADSETEPCFSPSLFREFKWAPLQSGKVVWVKSRLTVRLFIIRISFCACCVPGNPPGSNIVFQFSPLTWSETKNTEPRIAN